MKPFSSIHFILAPLTALLWAVTATATPLGAGPYIGSDPNAGISASAYFLFNDNDNSLTITLKNTGTIDDSQSTTLTGIFFDLTNNPVLTPMSATVADGSKIIQGSMCKVDKSYQSCTGTINVDGEWGYQQNSSGFTAANNAHEGISSSGYLNTGLPGNIGNFSGGSAGKNLDDPASLDGINFGIVSTSYDSANATKKLTNVPLIRDAVVLRLIWDENIGALSADNLSNVGFQYGTNWDEPKMNGIRFIPDAPPVPAPGTLAIMGFGLLLLAGFRFKIRI